MDDLPLLEFDPDLDRLADSFFHQTPTELLRHLSRRRFVVVILQPDNEIFAEPIIKIHIVDNRDIARRGFLETYIGE